MFHCTTYQPSYFLNLQRLLSFFSTKTTLQLGLHTRGRKKEQVQKKKELSTVKKNQKELVQFKARKDEKRTHVNVRVNSKQTI
jgi:hypothetical protein